MHTSRRSPTSVGDANLRKLLKEIKAISALSATYARIVVWPHKFSVFVFACRDRTATFEAHRLRRGSTTLHDHFAARTRHQLANRPWQVDGLKYVTVTEPKRLAIPLEGTRRPEQSQRRKSAAQGAKPPRGHSTSLFLTSCLSRNCPRDLCHMRQIVSKLNDGDRVAQR